MGFLFLPVKRSDAVSAFKEHVLQVMRQTGSRLGFINRTGTCNGGAKHIRLVMVFP